MTLSIILLGMQEEFDENTANYDSDGGDDGELDSAGQTLRMASMSLGDDVMEDVVSHVFISVKQKSGPTQYYKLLFCLLLFID